MSVNKLFSHPIVEPILDSVLFISSGILASSYLTRWINEPISNAGLVFAGMLSAASVQLAKTMGDSNNFYLKKITLIIGVLGATPILLTYLTTPFVNQIGLITGKAAFQIGVIHLGVKTGLYALRIVFSPSLAKPNEKGGIEREIPKSNALEIEENMKNYSTSQAKVEYHKLLSGETTFLNEEKQPNIGIYKVYFSFFKKHNISIDLPKTAGEIESHSLSVSAFYLSYFEDYSKNWLTLPLSLQYSFLLKFCEYRLKGAKAYYLFPTSIKEIEDASEEIITEIHWQAQSNPNYYLMLLNYGKRFRLKNYESSLQAAFEKYGLDKIGRGNFYAQDG